MKAQFVYENMDFDRGQDPKKVIGVGLVSKIMNGIQELKKKGYSNFDTYYDDEGAKDLYLEIHFGSVSGKTENEMKEDVEKAFPGMLEYEMARVWKLFYKIKRKYGFYFEEALYNIHHGISESLEFKRGKDPYDSLKIGRNHTEVARVKEIVDGNGKPITHPYDLNTFFGNIEMGLYPGNFYLVLDENSFFPSDELKERGYKKLLFRDKMHILG